LQELKNALKFVKIMQTTYMGEGLFVLRERLYKKHLCVCVCVCVCVVMRVGTNKLCVT